jgi:hypothetical protein
MTMSSLAETIKHVAAKELDRNEDALASDFPLPTNALPAETQVNLVSFVQFCEMNGVRALRSRPTSVAAFLRWQIDQGVDPQKRLETLSAIEALHCAAGVSNPVSTPVVMSTASSTLPIDPPRSWTKADKLAFTLLPLHTQKTITHREHQREVEVRRLQTELSLTKKRPTTGADKPVTSKEDTKMGTKRGPYSDSEDNAAWENPPKGKGDGSGQDTPGRSIDRNVTENAERNGGFPAPLTPTQGE